LKTLIIEPNQGFFIALALGKNRPALTYFVPFCVAQILLQLRYAH
jgi:hypothetical protein